MGEVTLYDPRRRAGNSFLHPALCLSLSVCLSLSLFLSLALSPFLPHRALYGRQADHGTRSG